MQLRRATPDDSENIATVHMASWRGAYRGLMPDEILDGLDVAARSKTWKEILANQKWPCYVATHQGRIVGFLHVCASRDPDKDPTRSGEISAMYLDPEHWRKGHGSALLQQGLEALGAQGISEVTLWVLEGNKAARAFYEKYGFTADGSRKVHPTSGLVELRYVKPSAVNDARAPAAKYYDLNPGCPDDVAFYRSRIRSGNAHILELGCGTGRVLLPLTENCRYIHGLDHSAAMLAICRQKLRAADIPAHKAAVQLADISAFALKQSFDLIIAPYRVFQNLATDGQVCGLLDSVREHLKPDGTCILNVFDPQRSHPSRQALERDWCRTQEKLAWEVTADGRRVTCHDRRPRIDREKLILYPELIYRTYDRGGELTDEAVLPIAMRCYYPDEFESLIRDHGFSVTNRWGGYAGEPYGQGPELVIEFTRA